MAPSPYLPTPRLALPVLLIVAFLSWYSYTHSSIPVFLRLGTPILIARSLYLPTRRLVVD
eukprot:3539151-Rhodomonas_salina.1